jgi:predicted small lipoprotein YifL
MMKKVISLLLMLMILSTFTACGQKGSTAGKESEAASETTVKAAEQ